MRTSLPALLAVVALTACDPLATTDYDLDGVTADVDCNDFDHAIRTAGIFYLDEDGDGWGTDADVVTACVRPDGYAQRVGDCDDGDPSLSPSASELCDGLDNDCDEMIDEGTDQGVWYADLDADGFGDPDSAQEACNGDAGLVANWLDCDDSNAAVKPGADELCDGVDNDCDTRIDEPDAIDAVGWYLDTDSDGYGRTATETRGCDAPSAAWADLPDDCNDEDPAVNPGQAELCDGFDNNCDGRADGADAEDAPIWYDDNDRDGYGNDDTAERSCLQPTDTVAVGGDCDDRDRYRSPDTLWFLDDDGDGYGDPDASVASCVDPSDSSSTYVDNLRDCDDTDPDVNPDATEVCDGIDNDCDSIADGGDAIDAETYFMDFDEDGYGDPDRTGKACSAPPGFTTDDRDCDDDNRDVYPGADEYCDGVDNDCDGLIDYADPDVTTLTWYYDGDEDDYGVDDDTIDSCARPEGYVKKGGDCDDTDEDVNPGAIEVCDAGLDNDCDGLIDTADPDMSGDGFWYRDADGDGYGDNDIYVRTCTEPTGYVRNDNDCDDSDASKYDPEHCWTGQRRFTNCGQTENTGPSDTQCDAAYKGSTLEGEVDTASGKQKWVVPFDATYRIEAYGAQAGGSTYRSLTGGKGARLRGDFALEEGTVLYIAVGQKGGSAYYGGGGGGGSFVVDETDEPFVVAGGGGAASYYATSAGCSAEIGTYAGAGATSASCPVKTTNEGESGSSYSYYGGGGGGMTGTGSTDSYGATGGAGWTAGLVGGTYSNTTYRAIGGFGGGGGAYAGAGGGGGYSGGNGNYWSGGGGSFNDGANPSASKNAREGHGLITIDLVLE